MFIFDHFLSFFADSHLDMESTSSCKEINEDFQGKWQGLGKGGVPMDPTPDSLKFGVGLPCAQGLLALALQDLVPSASHEDV